MSLFKAQYYDKPEGEDYVGKMLATNRMALQAALGLSTFDVIMYSHPKGFLQTASRFMYWMGPAVGMASAFTTGAYLANKLRGKDDKLNYCIGACAAAGVCGAWQKSPVIGFSMCLFFSIAGCVKKVSIEEGWEFFPLHTAKQHTSTGVSASRWDLTITPVGEKGWTTGKEN